jgi:hypothetical protein
MNVNRSRRSVHRFRAAAVAVARAWRRRYSSPEVSITQQMSEEPVVMKKLIGALIAGGLMASSMLIVSPAVAASISTAASVDSGVIERRAELTATAKTLAGVAFFEGNAWVSVAKSGSSIRVEIETYRIEKKNSAQGGNHGNLTLKVEFVSADGGVIDTRTAHSLDNLRQDGDQHELGIFVTMENAAVSAVRVTTEFTFDRSAWADPIRKATTTLTF